MIRAPIACLLLTLTLSGCGFATAAGVATIISGVTSGVQLYDAVKSLKQDIAAAPAGVCQGATHG